ncbi:amino acid permease-domain-containing protein [Aspergillus granulosus]|uniref:Amino acid permease-domain-containing protein n=1 Tax=Aspergillus granulosus TaxID=176169 RepID=A0ABR4I577_9EURO
MESHVDPPVLPAHRASTNSSNRNRRPRFDEQKPLRTLDVACLIINKMIGGGIFVSPRIVAHLTGNKIIALALWIFGGVYSFCSIYIYLEYGLAWPYNGGEFIYISKVFPVPPLLFASAFSWVFIAFATSTTNSITFARYINPNKAEAPDVWFTKFFACVIVVGICAVHYRFVNIGIAANNILAAYKVLFLGILVIAGFIETCRQGAHGQLPGLGDYTMTYGSPSPTNIALAILQVLYSYQGWENANYVTSEIKGDGEHKKRRLKRGAIIAISVVVTLYISFNMFVFFILDFNSITDPRHNVAADFAINVFRSSNVSMASHAIYVSIALAAAGNIIGVTFSNARVNRDIARHRLIPFYQFFSKSSDYGNNTWDGLGTPTGGLVLQSLVTCITIASIQPFTAILNMYTYGHAVVCFILGIGVLFIQTRMNQYETKSADPRGGTGFTVPWRYQVLKRPRYRYTAVLFFTLVNVFLIVVPFVPSDNPDGTHRDTPSWVQPVVVTALYAVGAGVALYVIAFVEGLRFRGSNFHISNSSNLNDYVPYNERRWIVNYSKGKSTWIDFLKPLPWEKIQLRLRTNGEANTAAELRTNNNIGLG